MAERPVACRDCGLVGMEDDDAELDPAPGLCPKCMNARMLPVLRHAMTLMITRPAVEAQAYLERAAIDAGMRPYWARRLALGDLNAVERAIDTIAQRSSP